MPKEKKRQHYVPQFYLRNFSKDAQHIFAFDKSTRKQFSTNVKDVAVQAYYYDMPSYVTEEAERQFKEALSTGDPEEVLKLLLTGDESLEDIELLRASIQTPQFVDFALTTIRNEQFLENRLDYLEGIAAPLINELINDIDKYGVINHQMKKDIAFTMAIQFLRSPAQRRQIAQVSEDRINVLTKSLPPEARDYELEAKVTPDAYKHMHIQFLEDLKTILLIADAFEKHWWILGINDTSFPLYTSDSPIVGKGHLESRGEGTGLESKGVEIAYPLSSRHIIVCYERSSFQVKRKSDCRARPMDERHVTYYNSLQVSESEKQIYCSEDKFDLARDMCEKYPQICEPKKVNLKGMLL